MISNSRKNLPVHSLSIDNIFSELRNTAKAKDSSINDLQHTFLTIFKEFFSINELKIQNNIKITFVSQISSISIKTLAIKFETPQSLSSDEFITHSSSDLTLELEKFAMSQKIELKDCYGVMFDGFSISFIHWTKSWIKSSRKLFTRSQLQSLLSYLLSLTRKSITEKNLVNDFGLRSHLASSSINKFLSKLQTHSSPTTKAHVRHWMEYFDQFHSNHSFEHTFINEVSEAYHIQHSFTLSELLFSIQSYLSLLMKLIAYDISIRISHFPFNSPFSDIAGKTPQELRNLLVKIEKDVLFSSLSFNNYLDSVDCFSWYINELDGPLIDSIKSICQSLALYHFDIDKTVHDSYIDYFSELYQSLIHPKIRKYAGEVYTPLWLADFLTKNSGWNGNLSCNILDPSCGSGIFILQFIKYIRKNNEGKINDQHLVKLICNNIAGFDLNPLAVLSARTNVLLSLYDLIDSDCKNLSLPIYLLDVLSPDFLNKANLAIQNRYFDKFDFIIGNPPWINWEHLSDQIKIDNNELLFDYQLASARGMNSMLGVAKYDLSAIFVYRCIDLFLKDDGKLSFVLTATLLKGLPARGFRKYFFDKDKKRVYFKLLEIHDLTNFQPFFDASPKTCIMIFQKGPESFYPVPYFVWDKKETLFQIESWNTAKDKINLQPKKVIPIQANDLTSNLLVGDQYEKLVQLQHSVFKKADYEAQEGCNTEGLNSAFWLQNIRLTNLGTLLFDNYTKSQKKKIYIHRDFPIEPDLVYPLLRSGNIEKWKYFVDTFIIFTPKYDNQTLVDEKLFQKTYPLTLSYFQEFKELLKTRASFKGKSKGLPYYLIYGKKSMQAEFKVVWNRMASEIGAVVTETVDHKAIGLKPPIPQETIAFISFDSLDEAHFVCGILNSGIFSKLVSMFQMEGSKGFGTPDILENIFIPKFNPSQANHQTISHLSKAIHELVTSKLDIGDKEKELDESVINLFGIRNILEN